MSQSSGDSSCLDSRPLGSWPPVQAFWTFPEPSQSLSALDLSSTGRIAEPADLIVRWWESSRPANASAVATIDDVC